MTSPYLDRPRRELAEVPSAHSAMMKRESWEIASLGEWLERRLQHITASDICVLFGCSPYGKTLRKLIAEKNGAPPESSFAMGRGSEREHRVADAVREQHPGWELVKATSYHWLPEHRLGASPDYWLGDNALIQCKRVGAKKWLEYGEKPPRAFMLQTLTEALVTDREYGILACTVGEPATALHLYRVDRHPAAERRILDAVAEFWREWRAPTLKDVLREALEKLDAE